MSNGLSTFLKKWIRFLALERKDTALWHRQRLLEELTERRLAVTKLQRTSETSDVLFTLLRADVDGKPIRGLPAFALRHSPFYLYMIGKYTSRWAFYQAAARMCSSGQIRNVSEVVNPAKDRNLEVVAQRHHLDVHKFKSCARSLRKIWPLLP